MLRKSLAVLTLALLAAPLFADVELTTSIHDVFYRGSCELAGPITMRVNADDFNTASTLEPVFIRITLDHEANLCRTLVNLNSADGTINDPIYLAMVLNEPGPGTSLAADRATVSIVRWVAGESAFWIRVQSSSSAWIDVLGSPLAPDDNLTVSWAMGISARTSYNTTILVDPAKRNLPFNTRNLGTIGLTGDAVSTLICVDLTGSSLTTSGIESLLNFDPIAFDSTAETSLGNYRNGNILQISFTNDFAIARGKNRDCTVEVVGKGAPVVVSMCIPRSGLNETADGWLWAHNNISFEIDCERGGDFLDTDLYDGSYITFSTGGRGNYGFEDNSARFLGTGSGFDAPVAGTGFSSHGETLYREIDLIWNGGFSVLDGFRWDIEVSVHYYYTEDPIDVVLDWAITLVNHDGEFDIAPFDGFDQHRRCPPSEFLIETGTWNFGSFVVCTGVPAVLFFPYMPKLHGDTALFWTGLSLVNQGAVDFPDLDVIIYAENGDRFTAVFPGLPVRNQYTWLLIQGADGTGFYEMGTTNPPIIPAPSDGAVDPASFGDTRMSMFVVGSFVADFLDDIFSGDLDGYLLIGKDTDIDGSYLPRNYDNDIPNQNADLPIRRSKRSFSAETQTHVMGDPKPVTYRFKHGRCINK